MALFQERQSVQDCNLHSFIARGFVFRRIHETFFLLLYSTVKWGTKEGTKAGDYAITIESPEDHVSGGFLLLVELLLLRAQPALLLR